MRKTISALYLLGTIVLFVTVAGNAASSKVSHRGDPTGPPCPTCCFPPGCVAGPAAR